MAQYDNPAGRLHALLSRLAEIDPNQSLQGGWSQVLEVSEAELVPALGQVAQLVGDVERAVDYVDAPAFVKLVQRYRGAWASPIFPFGQGQNAPIETAGLPSGEAMDALDAVATHLHFHAPEGPMPSKERISELEESITKLMDDVRDSDLPDEVKHLVLRRLRGIRDALGHVSIKGPRGVQAAVESLLAGVALTQGASTPKSTWHTPTWQNVVRVALATYAVFASAPVVQASLEAWPHVVQMVLNPGSYDHPAEPERDALPAPKQEQQDDE